jgi:inosine/xanthosine triphosphate pyrophosphatase family protein
MGMEEKNRISHRARAFIKLKEWLDKEGNGIKKH